MQPTVNDGLTILGLQWEQASILGVLLLIVIALGISLRYLYKENKTLNKCLLDQEKEHGLALLSEYKNNSENLKIVINNISEQYRSIMTAIQSIK